jgi:hypothetical protein
MPSSTSLHRVNTKVASASLPYRSSGPIRWCRPSTPPVDPRDAVETLRALEAARGTAPGHRIIVL